MSNHIKIQGTSPRIQYVADGKLNAYEFPFVIFNPSDINVYFNDKVQDLNTYTVAMSKNTEGGEVSFETAPASGTIITIVRNLAIKRTTSFQEGGALRAKVLNNEFDYQMACQQQIADSLNRSMVLPPYAVDTDVDLTLPTPSAGKAIVWNADGTNLENSAVKINELESTLKGYKESAELSATIAAEKADIATDKAETAIEKATEATAAVANKANTAMDNLTTSGKKVLVALGMPDYSSGISVPATQGGTYTAPSDGLFIIGGDVANTYQYYVISILDAEDVEVVSNFGNMVRYQNQLGSAASVMCPLPKGYKVKFVSVATPTLCAFYPMKGV